MSLQCDECGSREKPLILYRGERERNKLLCKSCYAEKLTAEWKAKQHLPEK